MKHFNSSVLIYMYISEEYIIPLGFLILTAGKNYLYCTASGDKIHVTDDIFKKAIEQRKSVVNMDINKDSRGAKMSTFKSPVNRKRSTSRLSTTTIWEMSVPQGKGCCLEPVGSNDSSECGEPMQQESKEENKESHERTRKFGISVKDTIHSDSANYGSHSQLEETPEADSFSGTSICISSADTYIDNSNKEESKGEDSDQNTIIGVDELLHTEYPTTKVKHTHMPTENSQDDDSVDEPDVSENWQKVKKVVRFVRPIHKPLNLENVTCKVPKGKSDAKDCLSKDPFYAGWAKLVGRRLHTRTIKRKDGNEQTVTVREGRSLPVFPQDHGPLDLSDYTRHVSSMMPPHQVNRKRLSLSIDMERD